MKLLLNLLGCCGEYGRDANKPISRLSETDPDGFTWKLNFFTDRLEKMHILLRMVGWEQNMMQGQGIWIPLISTIDVRLSALKNSADYKYARELNRVCEANKDGRVDYQEFKRYMEGQKLELCRVFTALILNLGLFRFNFVFSVGQ